MKANNSIMLTNVSNDDCIAVSGIRKGRTLVYAMQQRHFKVNNDRTNLLMFHGNVSLEPDDLKL